jgi:integrase
MRQLNRLRPGDLYKLGPGMHNDGAGLYLAVGPGGSARSWIFRYHGPATGKLRDKGIGPLHTVTLAEARRRAGKLRLNVLDKIDPIDAARAEKQARRLEAAKALTFKDAALKVFDAHEAGWSRKHAAQWIQSLELHVFPTIGGLAVADIDVGLVIRVLEPIWNEKPESASRIRGRIEMILDWATSRGYRKGDNPARWKGHLQHSFQKKSKLQPVKNYTSLPYGEIPQFMTELRQRDGAASRALELGILTACRVGEFVGARFEEFDLQSRTWVIPASRMKGRREHRVPLSDAAVNVIEQMAAIRQNDFVFSGQRPNSSINVTALHRLLDRMGQNVTAHGFRASFMQFAAERTNYPHEVRELALAHQIPSAVERAYQRSDLFDRRRRLMEDWATFVAGKSGGGDVVPLRGVR